MVESTMVVALEGKRLFSPGRQEDRESYQPNLLYNTLFS
jgi:hypothetical protein